MPQKKEHSIVISRRDFLMQSISGAALFSAGALDNISRLNSIETIVKEEEKAFQSNEDMLKKVKGGSVFNFAAMATGAGIVGRAIALKRVENKIQNSIKQSRPQRPQTL